MTIRQPNAFVQSWLFAVTVAAKIGRECVKQRINLCSVFLNKVNKASLILFSLKIVKSYPILYEQQKNPIYIR